ncbi:MAG TPA: hypothetical protein VF928_08470 [Usitatibacteraceae bacterium]
MNLENLLLDAIFPSMLDPNPVVFRGQDECGVGPVRTACKKPQDAVHTFRRALNRNAFLCGCLDFTEEESIEHLIIGLGFRYGSTTKVVEAMHTSGNSNSVAPTPEMQAKIQQHLKQDHDTEVIVFHNHPKNWANSMFDSLPTASGQDRRVMLQHMLQPLALLRTITSGGRVLFYLGENHFVREFRTPAIRDLLGIAVRLSIRAQC